MIKRVLLIDDDKDDIDLFREALEEVAPSVVFSFFTNARIALEEFPANASLPDLIFLDINLPIVNGWDFLKSVKENKSLSHIPVIMFTTSSQGREKETAANLGTVDFITKPGDFETLVLLLNDTLRKHL